MKTRLIHLLAVVFIFGTGNGYAQRFKPGVIVGLVTTDLVGTDPSDNDFHKAGFTFGASVNTKLSEKNSLQFEILYTQKGSLQPPDSANNFTLYKLNLDYVEVPLMFKHKIKFNINKKPVDRFYFEVGPSIGQLVRIKQESTYSYFFNDGVFKKNEVAINIGTGCKIAKNIYFNFRFSNSIIPVTYHSPINNNQLFIGYTFNKGDNMVLSFTFRYVFDKSEDKGNSVMTEGKKKEGE
jgi:hypothetical protein